MLSGVTGHLRLDSEFARGLAAQWFDAWNGHDLEAVLRHYADDVEFTSPFAVELVGRDDGTLHGIDELRAYFSGALAAFPDLRFSELRVAEGVSSITLCYRSLRGLDAAETMFLGQDGKIRRAFAHYYNRE